MTKKIDKKTNCKTSKKVLKGGRYLGSGAFGCVITPAIQCSRKTTKHQLHQQKKFSIARDDVSKVISRTDDDKRDSIETEIAVSRRLKNIDPHEKYFIYIKEHCKIHDVPKDRSNLASVRFLDEDSQDVQMLDKKKLDINSKVHSAFSLKSKSHYIDEIHMAQLFYKNFKHHARYLLEGIYKLHQNNIVQRDIKIENIMIDWIDTAHSGVIVRFIDFGLSEILSPQYGSSKSNIHSVGTPELIPIDIMIASELKKYYNYGKEYILGKIMRELERSVKKTFTELHLDINIIKPTTRELVDRLYKSFTDGSILIKYFGSGNNKFNGYVHKADIYSLGITFYEILYKYCRGNSSCAELKKNPKLAHLLKNMIELDPDKRYNIIQCLQHPYFH
jgi:serine/threonine protein kinase